MAHWGQELRYGCRRILRRPLQSGLIVASLALGIGANTAVFSLLNGILLKPLPFPDPDRIVAVVESSVEHGDTTTSPPNFADLRRQNRSFAHLAAFSAGGPVLSLSGVPPERLTGAAVTADFFPVLGTRFLAGRGFAAADDTPGAAAVAVISSGLWQRRFGSAPRTVGHTVLLDEKPHEIIGIVDSAVAFPERSEIWTPLPLEGKDKRGARWLSLLGRLRPGVSPEQGQAELDTIARRLAQEYPKPNRGMRLILHPLRDHLVRNIQPLLRVLMAIVGAVLLITCANAGSILLARFVEQERELAIRSALGGSRSLLLRPFLAESLELSLAGGAAGLLLARWAVSALVTLSPGATPRRGEVGIDLNVLFFTLAVSAAAGLLIGMMPLFRRSLLQRPASLLKAADRSLGGRGLSILRLNKVIATFEVALAVLLSGAAGLLVRSFFKLTNVSPGFRGDATLAVDISLPEGRYGDAERKALFYSTLLERTAALPGAAKAGVIFPLPLSDIAYSMSFQAEDRPPEDPSKALSAGLKFISPGLLDALGIPLVRGRGLTAADDRSAPAVALLSRTAAQRVWPGQDPVGHRIAIGADKTWITVVGVVGDVRGDSLKTGPDLEIYRPILQAPQAQATLVARSESGSALSAEALRQQVESIDPSLLLEDVRTLRQVVARSTARERFQTLLMTLFAVLALCLAAAGVFGVLSHAVAQRTHEIGIRMALGASRSGIRRLVVRQGAQVILGGLALGIALFVVSGRALASFLFGVQSLDLVTLGVVAVLMVGIGLLATALPVLRAATVDPMVALRYD